MTSFPAASPDSPLTDVPLLVARAPVALAPVALAPVALAGPRFGIHHAYTRENLRTSAAPPTTAQRATPPIPEQTPGQTPGQTPERPSTTVLRFAEASAEAPTAEDTAGPQSQVIWQLPTAQQASGFSVQRAESGEATVAATEPVSHEAGPSSRPTDDLDDLARRLYPKIRPYLKRELWLDRERAGMLVDL